MKIVHINGIEQNWTIYWFPIYYITIRCLFYNQCVIIIVCFSFGKKLEMIRQRCALSLKRMKIWKLIVQIKLLCSSHWTARISFTWSKMATFYSISKRNSMSIWLFYFTYKLHPLSKNLLSLVLSMEFTLGINIYPNL